MGVKYFARMVLAVFAIAGPPGIAAAAPAGEAPAAQPAATPAPEGTQTQPDPRREDAAHSQARKLLSAIDKILTRAAEERGQVKDLPSEKTYVIPPLWRETREDREKSIRQLLDAALEVVTDAPVVQLQDQMHARRVSIRALKDQIAALREKRLQAPRDGLWPGVLSETQASIDNNIAELEKRIKGNEADISRIKGEIGAALKTSGVEMTPEQLDLLLDSVLGGDLVKLVTAFEAARIIDQRLGELLGQSDENLKAARRYFGMHAALFAMLLHAQDLLIHKIDHVYLAKLKAIMGDIRKTREETYKLLGGKNRDDQRRVLDANLKSQEFAEKVASFYRDYLLTQRRQLAEARARTLRDLQIADNTFETVEASFELRALMEDARTSFEALQRLEAPGFDQVFKNENLRKEFENLTQKLGPTS